ncbi:MAG TPA: IclR family transcriptional regulator, partial [Rhizobiales bacterium]|nr:IclR family transcriptional regulator [Hyphomicrobiales bacterium]
RFVTALARGLDVLRSFKPGDVSLGNLEIARRTGLPKPTISRLTYTLTQLGYLTYSDRHGTYQLGPGVLSLGYAMLSGLDIRERARPFLQELSNELDVTVALGGRDRMEMVYLEVCRGPAAVTLTINVGTRIPLAPTAMGRALLAALPPGERDFLMGHVRERCETIQEYSKLEAGVKKAVTDVAGRGFCLSLGDWRADVNAVGVPLVTHDQNIYGLICGGPAFRISAQMLEEECGPRLVDIAGKITASG